MTVSRKIQKETYSAKNAGNHLIKVRHNKLLFSGAKKSDMALVLDSGDSQSAKYLASRGVDRANIHSPNSDEDVVESQSGNGFATSFHTTMGEFISTTNSVYNRAWLDYCGSWKGSKTTGFDMKKEVATFFKRKLLSQKGGVFAVTVSMHGEGKLASTKNKIINRISKIGRENGYVLKPRVSEFYGKRKGMSEMKLGVLSSASMLFLMFETN